MAKLDLKHENLEHIFEIDFVKKTISLKPNHDGTERTSLNTQQLYNWYMQKLFENMWARNSIKGAGFIGLQPVITFSKGMRIKIPK